MKIQVLGTSKDVLMSINQMVNWYTGDKEDLVLYLVQLKTGWYLYAYTTFGVGKWQLTADTLTDAQEFACRLTETQLTSWVNDMMANPKQAVEVGVDEANAQLHLGGLTLTCMSVTLNDATDVNGLTLETQPLVVGLKQVIRGVKDPVKTHDAHGLYIRVTEHALEWTQMNETRLLTQNVWSETQTVPMTVPHQLTLYQVKKLVGLIDKLKTPLRVQTHPQGIKVMFQATTLVFYTQEASHAPLSFETLLSLPEDCLQPVEHLEPVVATSKDAQPDALLTQLQQAIAPQAKANESIACEGFSQLEAAYASGNVKKLTVTTTSGETTVIEAKGIKPFVQVFKKLKPQPTLQLTLPVPSRAWVCLTLKMDKSIIKWYTFTN